MSNNMFAREAAVRVKVKKCEPNLPSEWRKFSVDPQITSMEVLYSLLAKAFDIKSDFSIKYKAFDPAGNEIYLPVLGDWDLDAAFLRIHNISIQTSTEPCLMLQIDIKPFTEVKEWDTTEATANAWTSSTPTGPSARELISPLQQSLGVSQKYVQQMQTKLPGIIMNQMEKTFSLVQKAFNLNEETMAALPPRPPLADNEFRMYLDALGQIKRNEELRKVIFLGGIDPSLRRVVWKHILNVYPFGMNGHQRMDYMRRKSEQYCKLRDTWKMAIKQGCIVGELAYVTSMVKKDVLRTDRLHPFYAGSDDNQNIASLFNILTTYALNHPSVSYCQGMSDIASPLLVTMNDEAQAYICFCAIMERVRGNFMLDGLAMTTKFTHLTEALSYYDSDFWDYLKSQQADDLLFCYRWLLLELKREFPFEDALRMLEVQWSSLEYDTGIDKELKLYEKEFIPCVETTDHITPPNKGTPISPSTYMLATPRENAYTKVCALRRQSSSASLNSLSLSMTTSMLTLLDSKLDGTKRLNQSLDDNHITRHATRRQRRATSKAHQSLDESKMLQLIESGKVENTKDLICPINGQPIEKDIIGDDEVFSESGNFEFHDTNPFKDDAPGTLEADKIQQQIVHKTFLNSSSSSIVADDVIGSNDSAASSNTDSISPNKSGDFEIVKVQNKNIFSNNNAVSSIARKLANASAMSESIKNRGGGHFKDLKEKIAATSRKGLSFDECNEKSQQRLVKNFNEFLNFASINKNRVGSADKVTSPIIDDFVGGASANNSKTPSPQKSPTPRPLVQLTKGEFASSLEESDSSSLPDTTNNTWSCATAIQQTNNLSSNSLHLELNSLTHTPERTPIAESGEDKHTDSYQAMRHDDSSATPDDSQDIDYYPMSNAITRELHVDSENLDRQVFGDLEIKDSTNSEIEYEKLGKDSLDMVDDLKESGVIPCAGVSDLLLRRRQHDCAIKDGASQPSHVISNGIMERHLNMNGQSINDEGIALNPFIDERIQAQVISGNTVFNILPSSNSLPEVLLPISTAIPDTIDVDELATTAAEDEIAFPKSSAPNSRNPTSMPRLPPPAEFGGGNPFLMFLCLTLLLQHRNTIMKSNMDYNEIAMHFDKMVRKHDVTRVLNQARRMYVEYLKMHASYNQAKQLTPAVAINVQRSNDVNRNATNMSAQHQYHPHQNQRHQHHQPHTKS